MRALLPGKAASSGSVFNQSAGGGAPAQRRLGVRTGDGLELRRLDNPGSGDHSAVWRRRARPALFAEAAVSAGGHERRPALDPMALGRSNDGSQFGMFCRSSPMEP